MSQQPSIGRIVHYRLNAQDAAIINRTREENPSRFFGNTVAAGDVVPLVMVRIWPDEYGPGIPGVNGQILLDGNHGHWVTSAREGTEHGCWSWPPRT